MPYLQDDIEKLEYAIENVSLTVLEESAWDNIVKWIENVVEHLRPLFDEEADMIDIEATIERIDEFLKKTLGENWKEVDV